MRKAMRSRTGYFLRWWVPTQSCCSPFLGLQIPRGGKSSCSWAQGGSRYPCPHFGTRGDLGMYLRHWRAQLSVKEMCYSCPRAALIELDQWGGQPNTWKKANNTFPTQVPSAAANVLGLKKKKKKFLFLISFFFLSKKSWFAQISPPTPNFPPLVCCL